MIKSVNYRGVNFGADNWLAFKNATMLQMSVWQKRNSFFTNKEDSAAQIVAREVEQLTSYIDWEYFLSRIEKDIVILDLPEFSATSSPLVRSAWIAKLAFDEHALLKLAWFVGLEQAYVDHYQRDEKR